MTEGEQRVRVRFNPSASDVVDGLKQQAAKMIDMIDELPKPEGHYDESEFARLKALAMTRIEEGAMWAVKAATLSK